MGDFIVPELTCMAWSCAGRLFHHYPLLHSISASSLNKIRALPAQDIANTAWAIANLRLANTPLMNALAAQSRPRLRDFTGQHLGIPAWSYAVLELATPTEVQGGPPFVTT